MKIEKEKLIRNIVIILFVIILEVFFFNFRYWTVKFSGLDNKEIKIKREYVIQDEQMEVGHVKKIEIPINEEIKNISLNISAKENENVVIATSFTDKSEKNAIKNLRDTIYNSEFDKSEYIALTSMQECETITLTFTSKHNVELNSITFNTWYFDFNVGRVMVLLFLIFFFMYSKEINKWFAHNYEMKSIAYLIIIGVISVTYIGYAMKYTKFIDEYKYATNAIREDPYQLLTKSIMNGKIEIDFDETSKQELLSLENYQDFSERSASGINYLFDFAFYNGHYYCYYGIVPVLTVLLPIALLFKVYFSSNMICIVYSIICMILLKKIYSKILKKYDINLKFTTEIIGFLALFLATGLFVLMGSANFYQAADLCGIAWGLLATYFILLLDNKVRTKLKLFLIGLSFGLMVCSRPIYVLYIIPIIICIFKYIIHDNKFEIKRAIAFAIPIIIIALAQMYYNYIRFDNIFEFGQFYNLTINNTTDQKMDMGRSIEGIVAYIFSPPSFKMVFPFIELSNPTVANGNIIYGEEMLGLIWFIYLWIFFYSKQIINSKKDKELKWIIITIWILALIMFAVNTCLAGINQRYCIDIQPALAILACVMWCKFLEKDIKLIYLYDFIIKVALITSVLYVVPKINFDIIDNFSEKYDKIGKGQYYIERMLYFYK